MNPLQAEVHSSEKSIHEHGPQCGHTAILHDCCHGKSLGFLVDGELECFDLAAGGSADKPQFLSRVGNTGCCRSDGNKQTVDGCGGDTKLSGQDELGFPASDETTRLCSFSEGIRQRRSNSSKKITNGAASKTNSPCSHVHGPDCGHERIPHGDHYDYLVPGSDGTYHMHHQTVSDKCATDCGSTNLECCPSHGKMRKVQSKTGEWTWSLLISSFVDTESILSEYLGVEWAAGVAIKKVEAAAAVAVEIEDVIMKTTLLIEGICCSSEVPIVEKILRPMPGVIKVSVNAVNRSALVEFNASIVTPSDMTMALNKASLKASVMTKNSFKSVHKYPPWNVVLGAICWVVALVHFAEKHNHNLEYLKYAGLGSVVLALPPIVIRAFASLRHGLLDINSLMTIAVAGAIGMGDYVEAAAVVILFAGSDWLEMMASERARSAISSIMNLRPDTAVLEETGKEVLVEKVLVGTRIAVKPGAKVAVDGVVVKGETALDESNLTGESRPVVKKVGDAVIAGTVNVGGGFIVVRTTALSKDSAVAKLVELVSQAQAERSPTEQLVQQVAKIYTPCVVLAAILLGSIPWIWGNDEGEKYLYMALIMLVIACPCALVISTPITYVAALAQAARRGILVKGGMHLETLGRLKGIALDKTGTLTEGLFRVVELRAIAASAGSGDRTAGLPRRDVLRVLHAVEKCSSHPIAVALTTLAKEEGVVEDPLEADKFEILPGAGVRAQVTGGKSGVSAHVPRDVVVGNRRIFQELLGLAPDATAKEEAALLGPVALDARVWEATGGTVVWVFVDGKAAGVFNATDLPRLEAKEAVQMLTKLGLKTIMLTGDNDGSAKAVQELVGITERRSKLLPQNKVEEMKLLKFPDGPEGKEIKFGMVGDGVNDAPALALSDVGMAMGATGTIVAMETADVALMDNDLRKIAEVVALGRAAVSKIRQNIAIAVISKVVVFALAIAGYAFLWLAIVADVGGMLIVTLNGLSLLERERIAPGDTVYGHRPECQCPLCTEKKLKSAAAKNKGQKEERAAAVEAYATKAAKEAQQELDDCAAS